MVLEDLQAAMDAKEGEDVQGETVKGALQVRQVPKENKD